jgi:hypothetical protein
MAALTPIVLTVPTQMAYWFYPTGVGPSGETEQIANRTATIDQPTVAYVAAGPSAGQLLVVPIPGGVPAGGIVTVNVTMNANSENGTPLPALVQSVVIPGVAAPPQAVSMQTSGAGAISQTASGVTVPPNPGAATISF